MKKLIISAMLGFAMLATVPSCSTTANNRAVKIESAVIPSVNIAMELWADRVRAGKATQSQVDTVKIAYENYYNAQLMLKAALERSIMLKTPASESEVLAANTSMQIAKQAVLNILEQFTK